MPTEIVLPNDFPVDDDVPTEINLPNDFPNDDDNAPTEIILPGDFPQDDIDVLPEIHRLPRNYNLRPRPARLLDLERLNLENNILFRDTLDIKHAFYSLQIHPSSRRFLTIAPYPGARTMQYKRLTQGLNTSPTEWMDGLQRDPIAINIV